MIPTEEQRAALKRVVAYMDEMYAIASPYYGCTEDANILRAMIDSSEHFTDATKMIGFDLERARGLRDFLQDDCAEVGDVWAEMIAEIERLREALDESEQILAHKTKTSTHWYEEGLQTRADLVQSKRVVEQQAARIKELESLVESSMSLVGCHQRVIEKREKALVEERAKSLCDCPDGIIDWQEYRDDAHRQLIEEGKIGPDADAKPHCWQITEERVDVLGFCLSGEFNRCGCAECDRAVAVLRAMLEEAE